MGTSENFDPYQRRDTGCCISDLGIELILPQLTSFELTHPDFEIDCTMSPRLDSSTQLRSLRVSVGDNGWSGHPISEFTGYLPALKHLHEFHMSDYTSPNMTYWDDMFPQVVTLLDGVAKSDIEIVSYRLVEARWWTQPRGSDERNIWMEYKRSIGKRLALSGKTLVEFDNNLGYKREELGWLINDGEESWDEDSEVDSEDDPIPIA
jgi:hypothetical protein